MDGLNYEIVDYINSKENIDNNAIIINELKELIANDPIVSKKINDWYVPVLTREEFSKCVFPYNGSWFLCDNGSSREQYDCQVFGPYTSEEILKLIRMEHFVDKKDYSFYKECTDNFTFQGGFTL